MSETSETKESVITAMYRTNLLPLEMHACLTGDCDHDTSGDCLEALKEQAEEDRWLLASPEDIPAAPPACGVLNPVDVSDLCFLIGWFQDTKPELSLRIKDLLDRLTRARSAKQGETVTVRREVSISWECARHLASATDEFMQTADKRGNQNGWDGLSDALAEVNKSIAEAEPALAAGKGE